MIELYVEKERRRKREENKWFERGCGRERKKQRKRGTENDREERFREGEKETERRIERERGRESMTWKYKSERGKGV